jgi:Domain of unknown function (DUF4400)
LIRVVIVVSLTALLVLVLYLPSAYPPQHFLAQLRAEHAQLATFWNVARAERVLARSLDVQDSTARLMPIPDARAEPAPGTMHSAVASEMSAVNARLFNSPYFRSVDALLLLASYRLFAVLEWLPWLALFAAAAAVDAVVVRSIKARQFGHHDPEAIAACAVGTVVLVCGTLVALVLPATLPPWMLPAVVTAMVMLVGGALRNFHRRA